MLKEFIAIANLSKYPFNDELAKGAIDRQKDSSVKRTVGEKEQLAKEQLAKSKYDRSIDQVPRVQHVGEDVGREAVVEALLAAAVGVGHVLVDAPQATHGALLHGPVQPGNRSGGLAVEERRYFSSF